MLTNTAPTEEGGMRSLSDMAIVCVIAGSGYLLTACLAGVKRSLKQLARDNKK